jgi:hypothetical protein
MANLEITWDATTLQFLREKKTERALVAALRKAGADAIRATRAEAKRQTRTRVRIRAGYLADKALPLKFPRSPKSVSGLIWTMPVSGREVPLGEYPRRQTRKGVSVEVQPGQRMLITKAFLATAKTGRKSVFLRPTKKRFPMGHLLGMSVADSMTDGKTPHASLARARVVLDSAFARLFPLELAKLK